VIEVTIQATMINQITCRPLICLHGVEWRAMDSHSHGKGIKSWPTGDIRLAAGFGIASEVQESNCVSVD
jgi:hypothetical protein